MHASIVTHFYTLEDPRIERTKKHSLLDILVIALCTLLTGGEGFQDSRIDGPRHYFRQSLAARTRKSPYQSRFATQVAPYDTFSILRPNCAG